MSHQPLSEFRPNAAHASQAAMRNKTSLAFPTWMWRRCSRSAQARRAARRSVYSERGSCIEIDTFQVILFMETVFHNSRFWRKDDPQDPIAGGVPYLSRPAAGRAGHGGYAVQSKKDDAQRRAVRQGSMRYPAAGRR